MRIVIAAAPKTGNRWLECLLGSIYGLEVLAGDDRPGVTPEAVQAWAEQRRFEDSWIFHRHCQFTPQLCDALEAVPARIVTIVRDPYDQFVSLYYWLQTRRKHMPPGPHGSGWAVTPVIGRPLDHPDVLNYLAREFPAFLAMGEGWLRSRRAVVVRYEGLHRDPIGELKRVTDAVAPVDPERITSAVETCRAENMRQRSRKMAEHIRSARVGGGQEHLSEAHLAIFRERHAELIRGLGYEAR